jgi:hypothetical protein
MAIWAKLSSAIIIRRVEFNKKNILFFEEFIKKLKIH